MSKCSIYYKLNSIEGCAECTGSFPFSGSKEYNKSYDYDNYFIWYYLRFVCHSKVNKKCI